MQLFHIIYLELQAVKLVLKHFLPFLRGQHVLVRIDNTMVMAYINRQWELHSHHLHMTHLLSRGNPCYKDRKPHSELVAQIWERYSKVKVGLFASEESTQCPLFLLPYWPERSDGVGCLGARLSLCPPVRFSPIRADHSYFRQSFASF